MTSPLIDPWRLVVNLRSPRLLKDFLDAHGPMSGSELARRANRIAKKRGGTVGPGIVNHLIAGRRTSCSLMTAQCIEEVLGAPPNLLFVRSASPVADSKCRQGGEAA